MSGRAVIEGRLFQGADEQIAYTLTTTPWGSSPSGVAVKAFDVTDGAKTDVTATVLSGAASVSGDVITLPRLVDLTARHVYRLEVQFTSGGNVFEAYAVVEAED